MKFTKKFAACLTLLLFALVTTVWAAADGTTDWGSGSIQVTGVGFGKEKYKNNRGRYLETAHQAARMDAQRKLAEYVEGVQIYADFSVADMALEDARVKTVLNGVLLRNAVEVGEPVYEQQYGKCTVRMEIRMYGGNNSVAAAAFLPFKDEPKTDFPQPVDTTVTTQPTVVGQNYTGLVIDCRGLGTVDPVMSPVIKNANDTKIYGHMNLNYDKIIVSGMAAYAGDAYDQISKQRAGSNPLVVKAIRLDDLNATPVVSVADADKILAANAHDKFLDNCAVVFVK